MQRRRDDGNAGESERHHGLPRAPDSDGGRGEIAAGAGEERRSQHGLPPGAVRSGLERVVPPGRAVALAAGPEQSRVAGHHGAEPVAGRAHAHRLRPQWAALVAGAGRVPSGGLAPQRAASRAAAVAADLAAAAHHRRSGQTEPRAVPTPGLVGGVQVVRRVLHRRQPGEHAAEEERPARGGGRRQLRRRPGAGAAGLPAPAAGRAQGPRAGTDRGGP